jgi:hypothetical protein
MSDNVIKFPGSENGKPHKPSSFPVTDQTTTPMPPTKPPANQQPQQVKVNEDQAKAIQAILSGMPFVFLGIKPTGAGADFYTAMHGDPTDLRNAHEHLYGVIDRLYDRKGL